MPHSVICSQCGSRLHIADDLVANSITCPRCLRENLNIDTGRAGAGGEQQLREGLPRGTQFDAMIANGSGGSLRIRHDLPVDRDVRRDSMVMRVGIVLFAILGAAVLLLS